MSRIGRKVLSGPQVESISVVGDALGDRGCVESNLRCGVSLGPHEMVPANLAVLAIVSKDGSGAFNMNYLLAGFTCYARLESVWR